jgi:hypothetical protein
MCQVVVDHPVGCARYCGNLSQSLSLSLSRVDAIFACSASFDTLHAIGAVDDATAATSSSGSGSSMLPPPSAPSGSAPVPLRLQRFNTLLATPNVDLGMSYVTLAVGVLLASIGLIALHHVYCVEETLRKLAWSGIPQEFRATVWKILLVCAEVSVCAQQYFFVRQCR